MSGYAAAACLVAALHIVATSVLIFVTPLTVAAREIADHTAAVTASSSKATVRRFPALFTFGDSVFDTGNNNALYTVARCDYPPYGKDFPLQQPTGRCSNGKLLPDMIASTLHIKELLPPYLTTTSTDELLTGVNFASIGTGYDPMTAKLVSVLSMSQQLDLFREYKEAIVAIAGKETAESIVSNSLYLICAGSNDVTRIRTGNYNVSTYINFLVASASDVVQELYNLGAKNIGVIGVPPVGCVPTERTLAGGLMRECVSEINKICVENNRQLEMELQRLQSSLQDAKIIFLDFFSTALNFIQRPSKYGFKDASNGCCSTGPHGITTFCNGLLICDDDSEYVFWDFIHPTEKTYYLILEEFNNKYLPLF